MAWVTDTATASAAVGAGAAVTLNVAVPPSVTGPPAVIPISGRVGVARPGEATASAWNAPVASGERP